MYSSSIQSGKFYEELEKIIVILITDYNLKSLKSIPRYITKWKIIEDCRRKIVLTDDLEIYIIELSKASSTKSDTNLDKWLKFINNPKEYEKSTSIIDFLITILIYYASVFLLITSIFKRCSL